MAYIKNVNFTHTNYEQGIAIAHIMHINEENGTVTYEYAVVGNPDLVRESEYYGTWGFSYGYFKTYEQAKEMFIEKINSIRQNRGYKIKFTLA